MKRNIILFELVIFISMSSFAQNAKENYILALSVNIDVETPARITCDNFATAFNKMLIINAISQGDSLAMFSAFVHRAKYAKHNREIDVRCKLVYDLDATHTTTVCSDGRNILLNGRLVKRNKKFINFLNSIANFSPAIRSIVKL